ncbi:threonine synthase [Erythrobacteraceae bacterium CFH 75059]|uniref:threonine synthase n=1 Tax=Qipengyuania thermophila TaxID=2509361 RepID=UPI00101F6546|nr:threonine synthase [Qipengyuania thermophila]TCD04945.1 threonine synthase [Erythrobacteraceae bacterium CFH 75059]
MDYISTRGAADPVGFSAVALGGTAPDGGLYMPRIWPQFTPEHLRRMRGLDYPDLAAEVMGPMIGDAVAAPDLSRLCRDTYTRFDHPAVTPLAQLCRQHWVLDLARGPTLSFKDVALQFLGRLLEHLTASDPLPLVIVGATSGDTGSAAIEAVAGLAHVAIVMLHPADRISDVQRRQMTTVRAPNVHNLAIEGTFDHAQALVKQLFADEELRASMTLTAVNSINWVRIMAQSVYYFQAALALGAPDRPVAFSVPTGNFGNVFSAYAASRMGLPVHRLVAATNVNDIVHRAIATGRYERRRVQQTATPSMDIQVSSNFERLLFEGAGRDGARMRGQMEQFEAHGSVALAQDQQAFLRPLFLSERVEGDDMVRTMAAAWADAGMLLDPHTAIALAAARRQPFPPEVPVVTLATAHPAKFRQTVERATGTRPSLPARLGDLFAREERLERLPATYAATRDAVRRAAREMA